MAGIANSPFCVCTRARGGEMAKKTKKARGKLVTTSSVASEVIVTESQFIRQVVDVFQAAKWKVAQRVPERSRRFGGDLIVDRIDLGRERRYDIECLLEIDGRKLQERFSAFRSYVR